MLKWGSDKENIKLLICQKYKTYKDTTYLFTFFFKPKEN